MKLIFAVTILMVSSFFAAEAAIMVGTGSRDLIPALGTPSAGYAQRQGQGMEGVHDPLLATAVIVQNGSKQIAVCSVDHLGFDYGMVRKIKNMVHKNEQLTQCEVFVSSSHTHSGGGAFMEMPIVGEMLAGKFDPKIREFYINQTVGALLDASKNMQPAKIGFGNSTIEGVAHYRGDWPQHVTLPNSLHVIKLTTISDEPLCVLFNFALHPTTLGSENLQFSSDFVGEARKELISKIGESVVPIYINGAQGEVIPEINDCMDEWETCHTIGNIIAESVKQLWDHIETDTHLEISTQTIPYAFKVEATPVGLKLPVDNYDSELSLILFNSEHAILTVPGELSCVYDECLSQYAQDLGYSSLAFFGLINDSHGYIITPQAWEHKTKESHLSFGGRLYGDKITAMMKQLLVEFMKRKLLD